MQRILPIPSGIEVRFDTPRTLVENADVKITLEPFSAEDREWFLEDNRFFARYHSESHLNQYLQGNYKFVIEKHAEGGIVLHPYQQKLDFACKLIHGFGLPIAKVKHDSNDYSETASCSTSQTTSYINLNFFDENTFSKLLTIVEAINPELKKYLMLKSLIDTAMSPIEHDVRGSLYVIIIESLVVPEQGSEVAHRFALRLTKILNGDLDKMKHLKTLYSKRSDTFHYGEGKFVTADLLELQTIASELIQEYLVNPEKFTDKSFNLLLLNPPSNL